MIKCGLDPQGDKILKMGKSLLTGMLVGALMVGAAPQVAANEDEPTAGEMAADMIVGRPFGLIATALGTATFIVSLPFSALGGNVEQAAEHLVVKPAQATFVRCLGCRTSGRYLDPDEAE